MKNFFISSFFCLLATLSVNANASATLSWGATPNSIPNALITSSEPSSTVLRGEAFFNSSSSSSFTHSWNFSIAQSSNITLGIINLLSNQNIISQLRLDGTLLSRITTNGFYGSLSTWSFGQILTRGNHNLTMSANSTGSQALYYSMLLATPQLTASPIPAAIWLFGSALLGIGGLASKRKMETAEA